MSAGAFVVKAGQVVRITDIEGGQPGDLVAFKSTDLSVKLSQARTRVENGRIALTAGHQLWTNHFPPEVMLTIIEDTGGPHDLLYPPCCRYALEKRFGVSRNGCLENLVKALRKWHVKPHEVPDPLNLFFCVAVDNKDRMRIGKSASREGSSIVLKAEMDCVVAVSTCAVPLEGRKNSGYRITVSCHPAA